MQPTRQLTSAHPIERFFAVLAALVCLIITIIIWMSVSAQQPMWVLPGLYLLEMLVVSVVSATSFFIPDPRTIFIAWGAAGTLIAFSILGAFSVGFFYLPIAITFAIISVTRDIHNKHPLAAPLGVFLIAGMAQAALMLVNLRLL
jgi:hypothetical protein